jgi:hypothetical protein
MMEIGKRRDFAKWQRKEKISDRDLCDAVAEMEKGLVDASLGGKVFKKRIARAGEGKSSGFRTLVAAKSGSRYVFMYGFAKNEMDNIDSKTLAKLQVAAGALVAMDMGEWELAVTNGLLIEVVCNEETD